MTAPEREPVEAPAGTRLRENPACKLCALPEPARTEVERELYRVVRKLPDDSGRVPTRADLIREAPARWGLALNNTNLSRHAGIGEAYVEGRHWTAADDVELVAQNQAEAEEIQGMLQRGELPEVTPEHLLKAVMSAGYAQLLRNPERPGPMVKLALQAAGEMRLRGFDDHLSALMAGLAGATAAALGASIPTDGSRALPEPATVDAEAFEVDEEALADA